MTDLNKLRRLAGVPVDLSKKENAAGTISTPKRLPFQGLLEAAKVPQHSGELSPKTKKNMRARVSCAKKALEYLELARDELMQLPAIDYMEDIPDIIKQLHKMLHGDDGTGGIHHLHRSFERDYNDMEFPEDLENTEPGKDGNPTEEELAAKEKEKAAKAKKKDVKESNEVGFEKQVKEPADGKKNVRPFKLADGSETETMYDDGEEDVTKDPVERTPTPDPKLQERSNAFDISLPSTAPRNSKLSQTKSTAKVSDAARKAAQETPAAKLDPLNTNPFGEEEEGAFDIRLPGQGPRVSKLSSTKSTAKVDPAAQKAARANPSKVDPLKVNPFEQEEAIDDEENAAEEMCEASGPLFARDAQHPKQPGSQNYPSWNGPTGKPVNVVSAEDGVSPYYPNGSKSENASQLATNPYNESQKVHVPAKIKSALKGEADVARKLAETFTMRKDWDNKNFHENLANAFDTLNNYLEKGTVYGIKEAQVFMTSLMSPIMNKIPADVIKFVAAGGTLRSLKSYMNDVKEPVTGVVFQQDSDGTK